MTQYKLYRATHSDVIASNSQRQPRTIIDVFHFDNPKQNWWTHLHSLPYCHIKECGEICTDGLNWRALMPLKFSMKYGILLASALCEVIELPPKSLSRGAPWVLLLLSSLDPHYRHSVSIHNHIWPSKRYHSHSSALGSSVLSLLVLVS